MLALAGLVLATPAHAQLARVDDAAIAEFDPGFFRRGTGPAVDVTRYERGNPVTAGRYLVDLHLNRHFIARVEVPFDASDSEATAAPCLDDAMLDRLGVDIARLAPDIRSNLRAGAGTCPALAEIVPGATSRFSLGDQVLELSIPQAALRQNPRGYVDPRFWDQGVTAARLGYDFNLFHTQGAADSTRGYLRLDGGVNLGPWRLRHDGSLTFGTDGAATYRGARTYAQRDIGALRSQLLIGDAFTDGQVFDSVGFRGVSLATDDRMLPESQRGYAPVVRGIARTNANVTIEQNGNLIYQAVVAPGPFEIRDLYATGFGGDLQVTVEEADGRRESFTVPFAAIPQLLRRGTTRFSLTAGEIRNRVGQLRPFLFQATAQHGISNMVTAYGGVTLAGRYRAALGGLALNTRIGAFGADVTLADAGLSGIDSKGVSLRVSYAKLISTTGTNFTVAAYRYSSNGFWSLDGALQAESSFRLGQQPVHVDRPRNSFQLTVTQPLGGEWGSFYLTGSTQQYWNRSDHTTYYQAGYTNRVGRVGYTLSASRQADSATGRTDDRFMLGLNFALGRGTHAPNVSSRLVTSNHQPLQAQATVSGIAGPQNDISWGATYAHSGSTGSLNTTVQYRSRIANLSGGAGIGDGYRQASVGAAGTIVLHGGGVTLGPPVGDAIGILHAPGAAGARVASSPGVRVDGRGYAIVPHLTPYARNKVEIDPKGIGLDVELTETSQSITPRAGAMVRLEYGSITGRAVIVTARMTDGQAVPFGASVLSIDGDVIGQSGQGGRMFVRGIPDQGVLTVRWGDTAAEQCRLEYAVLPRATGAAAAYDYAAGRCQGVNDPAPATSVLAISRSAL